MKIAISTDGEQVSAHFGRCQVYTIFEVEEKKVAGTKVVDTPPHQPGFLPEFLNGMGVNYVITGGMGPRAQDLFKQLNIEPIIGVHGQVDSVIQDYLDEKLESGESLCTHGTGDHHDCNHD